MSATGLGGFASGLASGFESGAKLRIAKDEGESLNAYRDQIRDTNKYALSRTQRTDALSDKAVSALGNAYAAKESLLSGAPPASATGVAATPGTPPAPVASAPIGQPLPQASVGTPGINPSAPPMAHQGAISRGTPMANPGFTAQQMQLQMSYARAQGEAIRALIAAQTDPMIAAKIAAEGPAEMVKRDLNLLAVQAAQSWGPNAAETLNTMAAIYPSLRFGHASWDYNRGVMQLMPYDAEGNPLSNQAGIIHSPKQVMTLVGEINTPGGTKKLWDDIRSNAQYLDSVYASATPTSSGGMTGSDVKAMLEVAGVGGSGGGESGKKVPPLGELVPGQHYYDMGGNTWQWAQRPGADGEPEKGAYGWVNPESGQFAGKDEGPFAELGGDDEEARLVQMIASIRGAGTGAAGGRGPDPFELALGSPVGGGSGTGVGGYTGGYTGGGTGAPAHGGLNTGYTLDPDAPSYHGAMPPVPMDENGNMLPFKATQNPDGSWALVPANVATGPDSKTGEIVRGAPRPETTPPAAKPATSGTGMTREAKGAKVEKARETIRKLEVLMRKAEAAGNMPARQQLMALSNRLRAELPGPIDTIQNWLATQKEDTARSTAEFMNDPEIQAILYEIQKGSK